MFSTNPDQIRGWMLPPKTLCLTFDDGPGETDGAGPGPKTIKLASFLHQEGITATFFAYGKHVEQYPHILPEVAKMGHIVGNHTYSHPRMPELFDNGNDCVGEILKTSELIKELVPDRTVYFRAPYGWWKPEISEKLNKELNDGLTYLGPYYWDVVGNDYSFWGNGDSAEKCAGAYLNEINRIGKGIVLMHDSTADNSNMKANNQTFEAIRILVPILKGAGYSFVGLDQVPFH